MTPPQLAKHWKVGPKKVITFIETGELPAFNIATNLSGRPRYRIRRDDVVAFERRRAVRKPPPKTKRRARAENVIEFF